MKKLLLLFVFSFVLINALHAEAHREPSVLPVTRSVDDLQVIRDEGYLYRKELVRDGIRTTIRGNVAKPILEPKTYTDFVSKKSCNGNNEGHLVIAYTSGNLEKAGAACKERLEGSVASEDAHGHTLLCKYSCRTTTLDSLQSLYFENFVRYIEPNANRRLN